MSTKTAIIISIGFLISVIAFSTWYIVEQTEQTKQMKTAIYTLVPKEIKGEQHKKIQILNQPDEIDIFSDVNNTWRATDGDKVWDVTLQHVDDHFEIRHLVEIGKLEVIK